MTNRSKKHGQRTAHRSGNPAKRSRVRHGPPAKPKASVSTGAPTRTPTTPWADRDEASERLAELTECYRRIAGALTKEHPANFLELAGYFHSVAARADTSQQEPADITDQLRTYATSEVRGFKAMGYAIARMIGTDEQRNIVDELIGSEVGLFPEWLRRLDQVRATEAWVSVDELAANAAVGIGFRFATGEQATLVGMINMDLGMVPLDAGVWQLPADEVAQEWSRRHQGWQLSDLTLADARAQWQYALILEQLHAPAELDDWRRLRAVIDWVLSLTPEYGGRFRGHGVPPVDVDRAVSDFLRSTEGSQLKDDPDTESIVRSCIAVHDVWHDPLRWSALAAELFLLRRVPRWHPLGRAYLIKIPDILSAFIRYGHELRGVEPQHTEETIRAIETHTRECTEMLEREWAQHGTERGVSGRQLLSLMDAETVGEAESEWTSR